MNMMPPYPGLKNARLSVFVDADNIPATLANTVLEIVSRHGQADLLRAYGNVRFLPDWDDKPGFEMIHSGNGKNAADMLICLDAMERALSGKCDAVLLVSSDQDFTHLATRLRCFGLTVIGAGEDKTSKRFQAACTEFHKLELPSLGIGAAELPQPQKSAADETLDNKIRNVIRSECTDSTGIPITRLSGLMFKLHGTRISTYPERTWRAYLARRPHLYAIDRKGPDAKVRYIPKGFEVLKA